MYFKFIAMNIHELVGPIFFHSPPPAELMCIAIFSQDVADNDKVGLNKNRFNWKDPNSQVDSAERCVIMKLLCDCVF